MNEFIEPTYMGSIIRLKRPKINGKEAEDDPFQKQFQ